MTTDMTVAKTILEQLGGNYFTRMTGTHNYIGRESSLSMKLRNNQVHANYLTITLTPMDTYTMEFEHVSMMRTAPYIKRVMKAKREDVYCDQLQAVFTEVTGLYTHF